MTDQLHLEEKNIDLLMGIHIRVAGEAGKTNGLPVNILLEISNHFQALVTKLAKYNLKGKDTIDLKCFELELFDFKPGSAIPAFILSF